MGDAMERIWIGEDVKFFPNDQGAHITHDPEATHIEYIRADVARAEAERMVREERERLKSERLKLDRRIRNQRAELAFWNWHMTEHVWQIFRSKGIMGLAEYNQCIKANRDRFWRAVAIRSRGDGK